MQVSNVTAGYPDLATLGKRNEPVESGGAAAKRAEVLGASQNGAKSSAVDILAQYDITRITPAEYSEMIQKLHQAGGLTDDEFHELAGVRSDLEAAGVKPDERVDLREFYANKIKQIQQKFSDADSQSARQQQLGPALRRLDWVEKFAVIQANPEAIGLDATA